MTGTIGSGSGRYANTAPRESDSRGVSNPGTPGRTGSAKSPAPSHYAGERLPDDLAHMVYVVWIHHGVRLGLNYGDCVEIARTALSAARDIYESAGGAA